VPGEREVTPVTDDQRRDERRLAVGAVRALALLAVPVAAGAAVAADAAGVAGALVGLGLVALLFGGAAALLVMVADRRPTTALGVMVIGVVVRLLAYAAVLTWLDGYGWVHRPSLAAATGLGIAVTLAYELRLLATMPRLFWIDADTDRPQAVGNATRSQPL
jgi:hypothetical protein